MSNIDDNQNEFETMYKVQICTGSISFLASLSMAMGIQFSSRKLSTPYRRLVYGLCLSDIIQSASIISGPFSSPSETRDAFWARGNIATCNTNGFMFSTGFTAVPMYVLALGIYYLFKLKRRMPDRDFTIKIEVWIHSFVIVWHLVTNIAYAWTKTFNPGRDGSMCFLNEYPYRCDVVPDVVGECKRGQNAHLISTIFVFGPCALCFLGICYCMGRLVQHAFLLLRLSPLQYKDDSVDDSSSEGNQDCLPDIDAISNHVSQDIVDNRQCKEKDMTTDQEQNLDARECNFLEGGKEEEEEEKQQCSFSKNRNDNSLVIGVMDNQSSSSAHDSREPTEIREAKNRASKLQELSILYKKEMLIQALLFIGVFFMVYLVPLLFWVHNATNSSASFGLLILSASLYPLGGLFNVLVHTRSNITALRRRHGRKEMSWLRAFITVLLAGGDTPEPRKSVVCPSSSSPPSSCVKFGVANHS
jgi:hypothetical protein